jgi:glycine/D-amino acid oxidase-like deaminating enzyme
MMDSGGDGQSRAPAAAAPLADAAACGALHIPAGVTLHPQRYMHALWAACGARAAARWDGSLARLVIEPLQSVSELHTGPDGPYAGGVVVAAGAAVGSLLEFRGAALPMDLSQGYSLDMVPPDEGGGGDGNSSGNGSDGVIGRADYPACAPSLLGTPYVASQGGRMLVVGATKAKGWSADRSLAECGREVDAGRYAAEASAAAAALSAAASSSGGSNGKGGGGPHYGGADEVAAAVWELLAGGAASWPPLLRWRLGGIRTGVRALPRRRREGAIPLMGRWQQEAAERGGGGGGSAGGSKGSSSGDGGTPPTWLLVGLGARGLVYHAWLGRCAALAVLSGSEGHLPPETLAWRRAFTQ